MSIIQFIVGESDTKVIGDWQITIYSPELGKESKVFRLLESKKDGETVYTPILVDEMANNESLEPFFYSLLISDDVRYVVKKWTFLRYRNEVEKLQKVLKNLSTLTESGETFQVSSKETGICREVERRLVYR